VTGDSVVLKDSPIPIVSFAFLAASPRGKEHSEPAWRQVAKKTGLHAGHMLPDSAE
jgi:hypothetical protein